LATLALWASSEDGFVAKKPKGWRAFDRLMKQLVNVPKEKVDKKIATDKKRRVKNK